MTMYDHDLCSLAHELLREVVDDDPAFDDGRRIALAASSRVIEELRLLVVGLDDYDVARMRADQLLRASVSLWLVCHARNLAPASIVPAGRSLRTAVEHAIGRVR